jgi:hypothetical protein
MTTNTQPPLKQELDEALNASSGTSTTISLSLGGGIEFNCQTTADVNGPGKTTVAYTTDKKEKYELTIKSLIATLDQSIADLLPTELQKPIIRFNDLMVIYRKENPTSTTQWLFTLGLALETKLLLKDLPVVGDLLDERIGEIEIIPSLRIVVASRAFTVKEVRTFNDKIPEGIDKLPVPNLTETQPCVKGGFSFSGQLGLPDAPRILSLPVSPEKPGGTVPEPPPSEEDEETTSGNLTVWFGLEKTFGPFLLKQIGFQYQKQKDGGQLAVLLDAAVQLSTFTLSCDDLSIALPLAQLRPDFNIAGIGIEYKSKNLEIGGAFLRKEVIDEDTGKTFYEYAGTASLKFKLSSKSNKSFGVSAIGAYSYYKGEPSLFLYAVLAFPLGGPPFFFVTGFALGFGYNRYLRVPSVDKLTEFPLVAQAMGGLGSEDSDSSELITEQLSLLDQYMTRSSDSGFIAIGLKFTCFKMLDCFALLKIAFGEGFEMNLLGVANLKIPTPAKDSKNLSCIASMTLLLRARFSLDEGVISMEAQLAADSYLLSPDCRLTGGFAVYFWFDGPHAGDFVITLGGYHPAFNKPAHYPIVPRLGFHWQVGDCLSLKGEMYFALCAHAIMAGGRLEANFRLGVLWANFIAEAHFLISWKPYYYDILVQVRIEAGLGILGPVGLGVKLHLWGPEFGGTASFKIIFVKVTIEFGDQSSRLPEPIDWDTFKTSFLPSAAANDPSAERSLRTNTTDVDVCTVVINQGITKQLSAATEEEVSFVVNPKEFELVINSVIPSKQAFYNNESLSGDTQGANTRFGIRSMGIKNDRLETTYKIDITRRDKGESNRTQVNVEKDQFDFFPVTQDVPSGLWGDANVKEATIRGQKSERLLPPEAYDEQFVKNTLSGFRIVPKNKGDECSTNAIDIALLQHDTTALDDVYDWQKIPSFSSIFDKKPDRTTKIKNKIISINTNNNRQQILEILGFSLADNVELTNSVADSFVIAPQVELKRI